MKAQDLFHPQDCIHDLLAPLDWAAANEQLANGVDEQLVIERCRGWAHDIEVQIAAETGEALKNDDSDYWSGNALRVSLYASWDTECMGDI